jgi:hypothetical protein
MRITDVPSAISIAKFLLLSLGESPMAHCLIVQHAIGQLRMAFMMMILQIPKKLIF